MVAPSIVKKIVESINNPSNDASENLPIEFYELREMAKRRVLLRDSVKMDATVYFIANAFLILLNILLKPIHSIFDLWALWFAIPWGVFLWIHLWVYLTDTEPNYRKKMFKIRYRHGHCYQSIFDICKLFHQLSQWNFGNVSDWFLVALDSSIKT